MIVDKGKFYLYRHIRLDKDEPFYIGIGTKTNKKHYTLSGEYQRAFVFHKENSIWKRIVNKTKYSIEILLESDDLNFIKKKEEEFIKLYGRINLKTGILSNLTDGGESQSGRVGKPLSEKHKKILSDRMKLNNPNKDGKFHPFQVPGVRDKIIKRMKENNPRHLKHLKDVWSKEVYLYNLQGQFINKFTSYLEASKYLHTTPSSVSTYFSESRKIIKGHVLYKEYKGLYTEVNLKRKVKYKSVLIYYNGKLINECFQLKECFDIVPFSKAMVYKLLRKDNNCNEYLGYRVYYKEDSRIPIIIKPENANLADLIQANPDLSKEELLYWCLEFKDK